MTVDETTLCKSCGQMIRYTGKFWEHIASNPRHPATPMNSEANNGGAAFPRAAVTYGSENIDRAEGMSLRDYIATEAMKVVIEVYKVASALPDHKVRIDFENISQDAYALADAMLKRRSL